MKFSEYFKARKGRGITQIECKIFGIESSKGWIERYADLELTQTQVNKAVEAVLNHKNVKSGVKASLVSAQKTYDEWADQLVYVMKNELGALKIGISKNPHKRSRELTTGSGVAVQCVAVWKTGKNSRKVESELLKTFRHKATHGEWFQKNSFTWSEIEAKIDGPFERIYLNEDF